MTPEIYDKFLAVRQSYTDDQPSNETPAFPFVPVFGTGGTIPYRFLIVGQATRGWADAVTHGTFDGSLASAADVLKDFLASDGGPFWSFVRKFIVRTLDLLGQECSPEDLYKQVAWSNLAKIGVDDGNPSPEFVRAQAELCAAQLRQELDKYVPDVVLIATGNYGDKEVLFPAFGGEWPRLRQTEHVQFRMLKNSAGVGAPAIWTNHPRNLGDRHDPILELIANVAAGFMRT
jgi:hypothetical protein